MTRQRHDTNLSVPGILILSYRQIAFSEINMVLIFPYVHAYVGECPLMQA